MRQMPRYFPLVTTRTSWVNVMAPGIGLYRGSKLAPKLVSLHDT